MKFVKIALPYDYLTTVLDCMEDALHNAETDERKEKIRYPYHSLLNLWGENAGIEEDE